jgi:hypothetical protein
MPSVAEAVLLRFRCQLLEGVGASLVVDVLVREEIGHLHSPVRTDETERELPLVDESYEIGTRHVQEIGCLLRGELSMYGDDRHSVSVSHVTEYFQEEVEGIARDDHGDLSPAIIRTYSKGANALRGRKTSEPLERFLGLFGYLR